ncbi:PaaI family thioesterase [Georgenia sp. AZ-5]|uniref:PaaI family thioesterase n=1 Tax=Georgenia sp. AZ-5 TaxID=3367526 RepID=UPI0037544209
MIDTDLLHTLQGALHGTLAERLGIELVETVPGRVVARMPVAGNTQPFGLLHGGASAALAETAGSMAATIHAGPDRVPLGTELNATHHRSATAGWVTATATALHEGRRTASYEIVIVDDDGRRVCTARLTCMLLEARTG